MPDGESRLAVRLALGASPGRLLGRVLRTGAAHVALGLALGMGASVVATRTLRSQLFSVSTGDPVSHAIGAIFMAVVAFAAIALPARSVGAADPSRVLRED